MKTYAFIITILLILSLIGNYILWKPIDSDLLSERHKISMDSAHAVSVRQIRLSDSIALAQIDLREKMEVQAAERERALKSTVNRQARSVATLKALRDTQGITPDTLSQAIEVTQDSTIQAQAAEIEALRVDGRAAKESFQASLKAVEDKFTAVLNENAKQIEVIRDLGKDLVKEKKKVKGLKWLAIILAAVLIEEEVRK